MARLPEGGIEIEDLPRIHDAVWVKNLFDRPQISDFSRVAGEVQIGLFSQADAMLGGDADAEPLQRREQALTDPTADFSEGVGLQRGRFEDIDVQIAIADMAISQHLKIGILPRQ